MRAEADGDDEDGEAGLCLSPYWAEEEKWTCVFGSRGQMGNSEDSGGVTGVLDGRMGSRMGRWLAWARTEELCDFPRL